MNVGVSVSVFAAPGLSIMRKQVVQGIESKFRGRNFPMSLNPATPINSLDLMTLVTNELKLPAADVENLLFLRVTLNGKELDATKSLTDNGVKQYVLLNVHLICK